jgi:uncharacterized alkaline shock family protein YloU
MTATISEASRHVTDQSPPEPAVPGRGELGTVTINDSVVAKIASRAALDVADAGAAATRVLGRSLGKAGGLGRETSLQELPKATAHVDGSIALIDLQISVRWGASVPGTADAVRESVRSRVSQLTGLNVAEVTIAVTDLVTHLAPPPRVR